MLATTLLTLLLACQHACVPEVVPCVTQHTLVLQPLAAVGSDTGSASPVALVILGIFLPLVMLLHRIGLSNLRLCTLIYMYYVRGRSTWQLLYRYAIDITTSGLELSKSQPIA